MANICTNLFYASSDNEKTIETIRTFMEENFSIDWYEDDSYFGDDYLCQVSGEVYSKWDFPEEIFEELASSLQNDDTLYMRCLSHELCNEYACLSVYRDGKWNVGV